MSFIRIPKKRILHAFVFAALLMIGLKDTSSARYDSYVYDNLQRSRDGLLGQREELQRARNDTLSQIDRLNQKVARIDAYLRQVDDSLRDVESSLSRMDR